MKSIICFLFFSFSGKNLAAQHCPYDGTHLIAIKVVVNKGKLPADVNTVFYLQEVDNTLADSCTSYAGLIKKPFINNEIFITEIDKRFNRNDYNTELIYRLKNAGVFTKANRMLTINQSEKTCKLIGKSETVYTNYIYLQRKFVIVYIFNGREIRQSVPNHLIYSLCTSAKEIEKFKPVIIKL